MGDNNLSNVISINNKPRTEVDLYLDSLGLWRKPIPKDGSCFYRAVSEQLFNTQAFHDHLQKAVEEKLASSSSFSSGCNKDTCVDLSFSFEESEVCGSYTEIKLLSDVYKLNFFIYTGMDSIYSISKTDYTKQILLFFDGVHYDSVYSKSFPPEAALCQSVIYDILYRNVFEMPTEIEEAVNMLRKQNKCKRVRSNKNLACDKKNDVEFDCVGSRKECENKKPSPPLPYRVAKALDPDIFRNVEFDNWQEAKRAELLAKRLSEFQPGDKCQVLIDGTDRTYNAHVQEITDGEGHVEVYVEELGKKCQVAYDCLRHVPSNERYLLKTGRKCRKAVTMVVHMNGTSQLVSSNLTTSTKVKKSVGSRHAKIYTQKKLNTANRTKFSRSLHKYPNSSNPENDDYVAEKVNSDKSLNKFNENAICECHYCKQLEYDQSNTEMLVTSSLPPTLVSADDSSSSSMFVTGDQPPLTNVNNNPTSLSAPVSMTSRISINPHIWIPYLERANSLINFNVGVSQDPCGRDLPFSDLATLRYFYNLGFEYHKAVSMLQNTNVTSTSTPQSVSSFRYNSSMTAPVHSTPVYYPAQHTYTHQLYAMYPQNFATATALSTGQSSQTPFIPCIAYMQNVQYSGNTLPSQ
ncbi:Hypothetical predicted protein [Octopus vulgaris]|uniref:OTU domain-containing protein n=1 Tax=Octopus vulgaris TaxID=6645 RepID=A0AA36BQQ9_OCTVU|nr:Hypothetical predicted protein [Octopus vulgaris]